VKSLIKSKDQKNAKKVDRLMYQNDILKRQVADYQSVLASQKANQSREDSCKTDCDQFTHEISLNSIIKLRTPILV